MPQPHDDATIREQAYYLWESDGRPDGRETEYWMRAKIVLASRAELGTVSKPAPKRTAKPKPASAKSKPAAKAVKAAPKLKAAASKAKAAPAKAEPAAPARKPKKK